MGIRTVASTCRECSTFCGSLIQLQDDKVIKISGNPDHPHSRGAFCVKGIQAPIAAREHPDRPLYPLRRTGERGAGTYERVSWESALEEIAERLGSAKGKFGARSIAGAVSSQYFDRGVAMSLLLRTIGSPNYMINQDLCSGCRATASALTGIATPPTNEIAKARCVIVVGKSPSESNIVEWVDIRDAKRNGAKLIVIDPRRTRIAKMADLWLPITPGTDAALALSMIHVLFTEGLFNKEFVEQWCTGTEDLRERASKYDPDTASRLTGIPAEKIREASRLFALAAPSHIALGHGIDAQANGVYTAMAFLALLALTGNVDREGAARSSKKMAGFRDYFDLINEPQFRMPIEREQEIIGGEDYPFWSGPDSWGKACHNPSLINAILTSDPYPVRALYVSGVNIVCTYPGMQNTIAALKSLDLLVVATDHITPTAELADFILPKTTLLEEEGVFFEAAGPCLSAIQRALPPLGEVKTDIEIACALRDSLRKRGLVEFEVMPWNSHREFIDFQLKDTGLKFDDLVAQGFYQYAFDYEEYRTKGFKTPSNKIELAPAKLQAAGFDPLPDYRLPTYAEPELEYDLILLTGIRTMAYHHSRFRNHSWARKIESSPELKIHPDTGRRLNIADDDWVWVETRGGAGRVYLRACLSEEVPYNIVATGMGWWYPEVAGADHGALRVNIEAAIPYGPNWDPISGSAEARNCACRIGLADSSEMTMLQTLAAGSLQGQALGKPTPNVGPGSPDIDVSVHRRLVRD